MRIDNRERIKVIGKLIGIYREERRGNTQNEYTLSRFCESICTINTLKRIESGECSRSQEIYDELLAKLNLRFDYFVEIDNAVESIVMQLYEEIEYFRTDKIANLCRKALRILDHVKEYVYYSELYDLFYDTYLYYKSDIEISLKKMDHYILITEYLNPVFHALCKRIIFTRACLETVNQFDVYKEVIEKLDLLNTDQLSMKSLMMYYFYITKQYFALKRLIDELEVEYKAKANYCRLLDVYSYGFLLHSLTDHQYRKKYYDSIMEIVRTQTIPDIKKSEIYSNFGVGLHIEGNYRDSLTAFKKMLQYSDYIYLPHLLYIADCQRHLNLRIDIPKIDERVLRKNSEGLQMMYHYYRSFYEVDSALRQNFLVKKIAPILKDDKLISIFRYEMLKTVDETSRYVNLRDFEKIIEGS